LEVLPYLFNNTLLVLAGCREISLAQHHQEYASGKVEQQGMAFFPTTKAHLDKIWGPRQPYYYLGSDATSHYILTQHIRLGLETYRYKIPLETKIENSPFYPTFSQVYHQYKQVRFK
jgi:hypothetical protein